MCGQIIIAQKKKEGSHETRISRSYRSASRQCTSGIYEHGFHGASLRRISADSGVSTNSIYTRFGDKAGLFAAVVGPVADGLMEYYLTCVVRFVENIQIFALTSTRQRPIM